MWCITEAATAMYEMKIESCDREQRKAVEAIQVLYSEVRVTAWLVGHLLSGALQNKQDQTILQYKKSKFCLLFSMSCLPALESPTILYYTEGTVGARGDAEYPHRSCHFTIGRCSFMEHLASDLAGYILSNTLAFTLIALHHNFNLYLFKSRSQRLLDFFRPSSVRFFRPRLPSSLRRFDDPGQH